MGVIQDMKEELEESGIRTPITIYAENHAEWLTCRRCGEKYISRGKNDFGICRNCEAKEVAIMIGGPLSGKKAYEIKS